MRKLIRIAGAILILIGVFSLSDAVKNGISNSSVIEDTNKIVSSPVFEQIKNINVKEFREKIGLYEEGCEEPYKVLDVWLFTLPEYDRNLLNKGFTVTEDKIASVIEDYTG